MKKLKVLHVVGHLGIGGDSVAIFNVLDYIKVNNINIEFEFVTHIEDKNKESVLKTVKKLNDNGVNVHLLNGDVRKQGVVKYYKDIKDILKNNKYDAIHVHTSFQGAVAIIAAKVSGIKSIISHSHTTKVQRPINKLVMNIGAPICRTLIRSLSTDFVACGEDAGNYLFGKNIKTNIIYNGINIDKFKNKDSKVSINILKKHNLNHDNIVVGHVGRFCDMKNQEFILKLAEKTKHNKNIVYILIGDGENFEQLQNTKINKQLNNIIFTGRVNNVYEYMQVFDYFILPSRYGEGLPVVLIEAQIAKCKCIASNTITRESDIGLTKFLDLEDIEMWVNELKDKEILKNEININKFDIQNTALDWINLYVN